MIWSSWPVIGRRGAPVAGDWLQVQHGRSELKSLKEFKKEQSLFASLHGPEPFSTLRNEE